MVEFIKIVPRGLLTKISNKNNDSVKQIKPIKSVKFSSLENDHNEQNTDIFNIADELKKVFNDLTNEDNKSKFNRLKRCYLHQQNSLIEEFEKEKRHLLELFKQQKVLMCRAFENEKIELLKEIEEKDKMLFQLASLMREESVVEFNLEKQEVMPAENTRNTRLHEKTQDNLLQIINNLHEIICNNNTTFKNLRAFENLENQFKILLDAIKIKEHDSYLRQHCWTIDDNTIGLRQLKLNRSKGLINNEKHDDNNEVVIQKELGQAHRKQKTELLKLFAKEKDEYITQLELEKNIFEKETRLEYESRMILERKAWQDTIEDCEREIAILKYEREQMDRNYCIGMNELKMEFELEKKNIYNQFKVDHFGFNALLTDTYEPSQGIYSK